MELIFIRHSITQGNVEHRFIGLTDLPITPAGEELARKTAPTLPAVEHLYRSPLLRCRQTAELLWPGVDHTVIQQLHETDFGPFEGKNHEELKDDPLYQSWLNNYGANPNLVPVGETAQQMAERTAKGLRLLLEDAKEKGYHRAAVVSHGGTMIALMLQFARPAQSYATWSIGNCSGYWVLVHEEPLTLEILENIGNIT